MLKKKIPPKQIATAVILLLAMIHPVAAQTTAMTISTLTKGLAMLATALFGLALLWGAAKIMFSGGDQRMVEEGKNHVKNAILGLILALIASAIPTIAGGLNLHPLVIIP